MKNLILLSLLLLLFACQGENARNGNDQTKYLDIFSDSAKELTFSSIRAVSLETREGILIGERPGIVLHNNEFFVFEKKNHNRVLRFDSLGNFMNKIGNPGRGPEEYDGASDFTVHGDTIDFLDGGPQATVIGYRKNGEFLYSKIFDIYSSAFEKTKNGYAFYTGYGNSSPSRYRLLVTGEDGNILNKLIEDNTELGIPLAAINMYRSGSSICIPEFFNNTVYKLNGVTLRSTFSLDYGDYSIPGAFYEKAPMEGFEMLQKNGFANIRSYFDNGNRAFFEITVQQSKQEAKVLQVLYDRQQDQLYRKLLTSKSDGNSPFGHPVSITADGQVVCLASAFGVTGNREKLQDIIANQQVLNGLDENDNPVVLFCKIN